MKIENLVPPLDLCKQIPAGKFEDSALVYFWLSPGNKYIVIQRSETPCIPRSYPPCPCGMKYFYPAPTLQEIMSAIPHCRAYKKTNGGFIAVHEKIRVTHMNGATAALKLWFKNKGIKE